MRGWEATGEAKSEESSASQPAAYGIILSFGSRHGTLASDRASSASQNIRRGREGEGSQATGALDHERENKQTDGQK